MQMNTPLEFQDSEPIYTQLKEILTQKIVNGEFPPGARLPSEYELTELYHISRSTVRLALKELEASGMIVRRRGKGTFVSSKKLFRSLSEVSGFTAMCQYNGVIPGARVLRSTIEEPKEEERVKLKLQEYEKILVIMRIRYANEVPVCLETSKFSEKFSFLLEEDLTGSLYEKLKEKGGIKQFIPQRKFIDIVYADYDIAKYLSVPKVHPLISLVGVPIDQDGHPIHISEQLIVSGRMRFIV